MEKKLFGTLPCGEKIYTHTLKNDVATLVTMNRGATIVSFNVYGTDIIGGFDTLRDYLSDDSHQGATIGRVANRIKNAQFSMDGTTYRVTENDNGNCLHGGDGFDHRVWQTCEVTDNSITYGYLSHDGEEGFPASVDVKVKFTLDAACLRIDYCATPSGKTPISLTNHSYFNLDGFGGNVREHTMRIYASSYTEVDESLIPTGVRPSVLGTAFDFTTPHKIGERVGGDFIGYDHNFVLSGEITREFDKKVLALAAEVSAKRLSMSVYTDQAGIQFYMGNFLGDGPDFFGNIPQVKHGAFCLETQTEPNSINRGVGFYSAGEVYTHTTVYKIEKTR